jgi:cold shock protein
MSGRHLPSAKRMIDIRRWGLYECRIDICLLAQVIARLAPRPRRTSLSKIVTITASLSRGGSSNAMKGFIMTTGTVKWFNSAKGFGFIQPDNGGADAFVHISAVERAGMSEIVEGQKIGYDMERDNKSGKMAACNLQAA